MGLYFSQRNCYNRHMGVETPNNVRNVERMRTEKHTKLNTWRQLKGLEPVQSWKCRLGIHQWTNWELFEEEYVRGGVSVAQCYCARCGMPRRESPLTRKIKKGT